MGWLHPVLTVLILLGIMILIHELGHYLAAIAVGIKVEAFSFGLGPRLFGIRLGETDFRLSAVPFGGFVKMLGEQPGEEATDPRSFQAKTRWQRAIVVFAGPFMNVVLAVAIMTGIYMHAFLRPVDSTDPVISNVAANSAAATAGLQAGDRILQIDSKRDPNWQDVITREALSPNQPMQLVIDRRGQKLHATVRPSLDPKQGIGVAGWTGDPDVQVASVLPNAPAAKAGLQKGDLLVSIAGHPIASGETMQSVVAHSGGKPVDLVFMRDGKLQRLELTPVATQDSALPWRIGISMSPRGEVVKLGFLPAMGESLRFNKLNATLIFQVMGSIVERRVSPKMLEGPISIAKASAEAAREGLFSYFGLMAVVSLNLAIFNLLPIPILDGGTLLMLAIESLIRRDLSLPVKEAVFRVGLVFLMMIVVFVIYNDLTKI